MQNILPQNYVSQIYFLPHPTYSGTYSVGLLPGRSIIITLLLLVVVVVVVAVVEIVFRCSSALMLFVGMSI
jgi:hypothetical protein